MFYFVFLFFNVILDSVANTFFGETFIKKDGYLWNAGELEINPSSYRIAVLPKYAVVDPRQDLTLAIQGYDTLENVPLRSSSFNVTIYWLNVSGVQALLDAGFARDVLLYGNFNSTTVDLIKSLSGSHTVYEIAAENGFSVLNVSLPYGIQAALVDVNESGFSIIVSRDALYGVDLLKNDVHIELDVKWDVRFDPNVGGYVPQDNFTVELEVYNSTGYLANTAVYVYTESGGKSVITDARGRATVTFPILNSVLNTSDNILVFAICQDTYTTSFAKLPPLSPYYSEVESYASGGKLFVSVSNYYLGNSSAHPFVLEVRKISEDGGAIEDISAEYVNASSVLRYYDVGFGRYEVIVSYDNEFGHHEFRKTVVYTPLSFGFSNVYLQANGSSAINVPVMGAGGVVYTVETSRGFDGVVYSIVNISSAGDYRGSVSIGFTAPPSMKEGTFTIGVVMPEFSMPNVSFGDITVVDSPFSDVVPFYIGPSTINSGSGVISIGLANLGIFQTEQMDVEIYVDGSLYGMYTVGPIMPYDVQSLDLALSLNLGVHEIRVVVDVSNTTAEFDEVNNSIAFYIILERVYNVSGNVFLENISGACSVYVDIYEHPFLKRRVHTSVDGQSYSVRLRNGTYDVLAFADLDCDGTLDAYEPVGYAINKTVFYGPDRIVVGGSNVSNVDITLNAGLNLRGDINGDWVVDISDVVKIVYMMFGKVSQDIGADFNGNAKVDVGDLARLVYYLIGNLEEL